MPTFLSDPPPSLYLALAVALLLAGAVWFNRRSKASRTVLLVMVGLLGLLLLLDFLTESPREEAVRAAQALVKAADTKDTVAFAAQVADTFRYQGENAAVTVTREQVRTANFWNILKEHDIHVAAWDFSRADAKELDANTVEIGFLGKGEAKSGALIPMYFRATFTRQLNGKMALSALASFDPLKRANERKSIPNFP